jgi:hypothetical protein
LKSLWFKGPGLTFKSLKNYKILFFEKFPNLCF